MTHHTFEYTGTFPTMCQAEIVTTSGVFRARVECQIHPEQPEDDYGYPILEINSRHCGDSWNVSDTGYGKYSYDADGIGVPARHALENFLNAFGYSQGIAVFARWLSIFHGGKIETWHVGYNVWDNTAYLTYDTAKMRHAVGLPERGPNMTEWIAWLENEVYGVVLEQAVDYCEHRNELVWEEIESWWGFYGLKFAEEEAGDWLDDLIVESTVDQALSTIDK